jgi:hypothetical protein
VAKPWADWWNWELEFSSELPDRMLDRGFNETDLRQMLHDAIDWGPDKEMGRYAIHTRWDNGAWEIIVEPDWDDQRLVIITAYRLE